MQCGGAAPAATDAGADADAERRRKDGRMWHVAVRYVAPPSAAGDLVGAWRDAMKETSKCGGR